MIPFQQLNISPMTQEKILSSEVGPKMLLAQGRGCASDEEALAVGVVLSQDHNPSIVSLTKSSLSSWTEERLSAAITRQTHTKVLEFIIEFLPCFSRVDEFIFQSPNINERTSRLIAQRANAQRAQVLSNNSQTFLMYPSVYWLLYHNTKCPRSVVEPLESMRRQQKCFEEAPSVLQQIPQIPKLPIENIAIEVLSALQGKPSPALQLALSRQMFLDVVDDSSVDLGGFVLDFNEADGFSFESALIEETEEDNHKSIEQRVRDMSVGEKIKLAFKGNEEARGILIRDTNRSVSSAVLKSGRVNPSEAAKYAANRNLSDEVIRIISSTKEFMSKTNVRLALVNNPKTPPKIAMSILVTLNKRDLQALAKNRSVSGTVSKAAMKRFKELYQR